MEDEKQDSSFLTTGSYSVASVVEGEFVVAIICDNKCPEADVLMKAKEMSHNIKMLFGHQIDRLSQQRPDELSKIMPHTSLLKMMLMCSELEAEGAQMSGSSLDPTHGAGLATQNWLRQHAQNDDLHKFFVSKLRSTQGQRNDKARSTRRQYEVNATAPRSQRDSTSRSTRRQYEVNATAPRGQRDSTSRSTRQHLEVNATAPRVQRDSTSRSTRRHLEVNATSPRGQRDGNATVHILRLRDYDPSLVVIYKGEVSSPSPVAGPVSVSASSLRVTYEDAPVPPSLIIQLESAALRIHQRFPSTRAELLRSIWPTMPSESALEELSGGPRVKQSQVTAVAAAAKGASTVYGVARSNTQSTSHAGLKIAVPTGSATSSISMHDGIPASSSTLESSLPLPLPTPTRLNPPSNLSKASKPEDKPKKEKKKKGLGAISGLFILKKDKAKAHEEIVKSAGLSAVAAAESPRARRAPQASVGGNLTGAGSRAWTEPPLVMRVPAEAGPLVSAGSASQPPSPHHGAEVPTQSGSQATSPSAKKVVWEEPTWQYSAPKATDQSASVQSKAPSSPSAQSVNQNQSINGGVNQSVKSAETSLGPTSLQQGIPSGGKPKLGPLLASMLPQRKSQPPGQPNLQSTTIQAVAPAIPQAALRQVGSAQVGSGQVGSAQVGLGQGGSAQVGSGHVVSSADEGMQDAGSVESLQPDDMRTKAGNNMKYPAPHEAQAGARAGAGAGALASSQFQYPTLPTPVNLQPGSLKGNWLGLVSDDEEEEKAEEIGADTFHPASHTPPHTHSYHPVSSREQSVDWGSGGIATLQASTSNSANDHQQHTSPEASHASMPSIPEEGGSSYHKHQLPREGSFKSAASYINADTDPEPSHSGICNSNPNLSSESSQQQQQQQQRKGIDGYQSNPFATTALEHALQPSAYAASNAYAGSTYSRAVPINQAATYSGGGAVGNQTRSSYAEGNQTRSACAGGVQQPSGGTSASRPGPGPAGLIPGPAGPGPSTETEPSMAHGTLTLPDFKLSPPTPEALTPRVRAPHERLSLGPPARGFPNELVRHSD
eukprot:gene32451-31065_t